jgi:hypothetical protein
MHFSVATDKNNQNKTGTYRKIFITFTGRLRHSDSKSCTKLLSRSGNVGFFAGSMVTAEFNKVWLGTGKYQ